MMAQILLGSLTAGAIYALVALGFVLIYKGTGIVHFGYGEQLTFGAYAALIFQTQAGLAFTPSLFAALVTSIVLGSAIFLLFAGPLRNATLWTRIIATLAIGIALREGLRAYMGPTAWPFPSLLSQQAFQFGGIYLVPANLAILGVVIVILIGLFLYLERSLRGKAILASCENPVGAGLVGIRVSYVHLSIWILASLLAAIAGILVAPQLTLSPDMGLISIKGFTAAVIGGFSSLPGAVFGGLLLGVLEGFAGAYVSSALKDMISYAVLIAVILLMPHGLFGKLSVKKV